MNQPPHYGNYTGCSGRKTIDLLEHLGRLPVLDLEERDRLGYQAQPQRIEEYRGWEEAAACRKNEPYGRKVTDRAFAREYENRPLLVRLRKLAKVNMTNYILSCDLLPIAAKRVSATATWSPLTSLFGREKLRGVRAPHREHCRGRIAPYKIAAY